MKTRNIPPLKVVFSNNDRKEILAKVDHALKIGYVTMGENVKEFEERFSEYNNSKHSILVSTSY
jgi:dTDP-4-amino-4,6-dideoxygalactose transaminase